MKTVLYYFTGTGNSLVIANDLARELDAPEPMPIAGCLEGVRTEAEVIGLVFPVYYLDMPELVKEFVEKLEIANASAYIFAVANCGGNAGNTLANLDRMLKRKGRRLAAGHVIKMPDNSVAYWTPSDEQKKDFETEKELVKTIAITVSRRETHNEIIRFKNMDVIHGKGLAWVLRSVIGINNKQCLKEKCNHCGLCVKICPVGNIDLRDGRVRWGSNCQECFACIHGCPYQAIRFGRLKLHPDKVYRHPEISLQQIAGQSKERFKTIPNTDKI